MPPPRQDAPAPTAPDFEALTLLLSAATADELGRAARQRGLSPPALIARIVRDFLRQEAGHRPHAQG